MYTPEALLDMHERGHRGLISVMQHCEQLSAEDFARELEGFGYPSLALQFDHLIGAEEYWISVLQGNWNTEGHMPTEQTLPLLQEYRAWTQSFTAEFLRSVSSEWLNTPVDLGTWPEGKARTLLPAAVFMRTLTHQFQHRGQVLAMCRLVGHPVAATDFPIGV